MAYQSSDLFERVELRRATKTADGAGGFSEAWSTYATVWAHVRPMSGRERNEAGRLEASANYLVAIRYRSDVKDTDVIRWNSRDMNIRFIKDRGRVAFLEIEAEMGAAA